MRSYASHNRKSMPPPKKALSPASRRAKADKRNARLQEKRAADVAESGGGPKSGKKKRKMTDLTEEEMPVSGGGSPCTWKRSGELFEAEREAGAGRRGGNVLREGLRENPEGPRAAKHVYGVATWSGLMPRRQRESLVLEKKYRDEKKYREKEYVEAQQQVDEQQKAHFTCLEHDIWTYGICVAASSWRTSRSQ
jgi:hypothetical protein